MTKPNKPRRVQSSIMMPPHILEAMEKLAEIEQRSLSQQVTLACTEHLKHLMPATSSAAGIMSDYPGKTGS
jgi:hypothetical protein